MARMSWTIVVVALLTASCGGGGSSEASSRTTTPAGVQTSAQQVSETTAAAETTTTANITTTTVTMHPFDRFVLDSYGLQEVGVQDPDTGEWLEYRTPSDAVVNYYCTGVAPAENGMWAWVFAGQEPPEVARHVDTWKEAFWDVAAETFCSEMLTTSPPINVDVLAAGLVPFFYPGYELDSVVATGGDTPSSIRLVARSAVNPGFQIAFDAEPAEAATRGCDFTDPDTGATWCHSTGTSGLEAFAGRNALIPVSHRESIEATLSNLNIVITDFGLISNVEIALKGIDPSTVETWDGVSYDQMIGLSLDMIAGTWVQN